MPLTRSRKSGFGKQAGPDPIGLFDVLLRQDGHPLRRGRSGQHQLFQAGAGCDSAQAAIPRWFCRVQALVAFADGTQRAGLEANATRCAAHEFNDAFAGQGLQVFFGCIGRFEAPARWRFRPVVGEAPVRAMARWISSKICCWRGVSLGFYRSSSQRRSHGSTMTVIPIQDCLFVQYFYSGWAPQEGQW